MKSYIPSLVISTIFIASLYAQQKETRKLQAFSSITVGEAIEVELTAGNKHEAIVQVDGKIELEDVITDVSGGRLRIKKDWGKWKNTDVRVLVTYIDLEKIEVSSAAILSSLKTIEEDQLKVQVSSAGECDINVDVDELSIRVSSSGDLTIKGAANDQTVRVSSAGDYDGYDLQCKHANVDVSSAGDARIFVTNRLEAEASSAGSVSYKGDPDKVSVDTSSGGSIKKS